MSERHLETCLKTKTKQVTQKQTVQRIKQTTGGRDNQLSKTLVLITIGLLNGLFDREDDETGIGLGADAGSGGGEGEGDEERAIKSVVDAVRNIIISQQTCYKTLQFPKAVAKVPYLMLTVIQQKSAQSLFYVHTGTFQTEPVAKNLLWFFHRTSRLNTATKTQG